MRSKSTPQCAMNNLEDDYVPLDEFTAEQDKVEALKRQVLELEASGIRVCAAPTVDKSSQTRPYKGTEAAVDDRCKQLYKEKCAIEGMCEDKQLLILSLEKRLLEMNGTLEMVRNGFLEKSADLEVLQIKFDDQMKSMAEILQQNAEKDREIVSLKAELTKASQKSPVQPKTKRSLLANIREAVTSPRKGATGRTLRKTARTAQH